MGIQVLPEQPRGFILIVSGEFDRRWSGVVVGIGLGRGR